MNSTNTGAFVHVDGHHEASAVRDVLILMLNGLTAVLGLVGNMIVCKVLFVSKKLRVSPTYAHMASMAVSDILGAASIPGQWLFCAASVLRAGSGATFFCALFKSLGVLSWFVSTWSMTAIAIDRYLAVHKPHFKRLYTWHAIAAVWLYSWLFIIFTGSSIKISVYFSEPIISCDVIFKNFIPLPFQSHTIRRIRVAGVLLTQYAIPLVITAILYGYTVRTVWMRNVAGQDVSDRKLAKKRKTIIMMIVVVVVFALSWLPLHIYHLLNFFGWKPYKKGVCNASSFYLIFWWLGISSCFYNPFIYFWMDPMFRAEWLKIWSYIQCRSRSQAIAPVKEIESTTSNNANTQTTSQTGDASVTDQL